MKKSKYTLTATLWLYPGENANWHFITIPKKESTLITDTFKAFKKGWGSLPVSATIGKTEWRTSIFPDAKSGTYLLPIKALVRQKEGLEVGDSVMVTVTIMSQFDV